MAWFNRKQKEIPVWVTSEKYDDLIKRDKINPVSGQQLVQMRKWCFENEDYILKRIEARKSYEDDFQRFSKTLGRFRKALCLTNDITKTIDYYSDKIQELEDTYISQRKIKENLTEYYNRLLETKKELDSISDEYNKFNEFHLNVIREIKPLLEEDRKIIDGMKYLTCYIFRDITDLSLDLDRYFDYGYEEDKTYYEEDKERLEDLIYYCEEQLNK